MLENLSSVVASSVSGLQAKGLCLPFAYRDLVLTICLPRSKGRPLFAISRELLTILLFF